MRPIAVLVLIPYSLFAQLQPRTYPNDPGPAPIVKPKSLYCSDHPFEKACLQPIKGLTGVGMGSPVRLSTRPSSAPKATAPKTVAPKAVIVPPTQRLLASSPAMIHVGEPDWRFVDPRAILVGGLNLESLTSSPMVAAVMEKLKAKVPAMNAATAQLEAGAGIRRVIFSLSEGRAEASMLALITGTVDEKDLVKGTQGKLQARRLDLENVLLGDPASIDSAVRRMNLPAMPREAVTLTQAKSLWEGQDFWLAGSLPNLPQTATIRSAFKSMAFGLTLQKDLYLEMHVDTGDVNAASDLVAKAMESRSQLPPGSSLVADANGSQVHVRFAMAGGEIEKLVIASAEQFAGSMTEALTQAGFSAAPASASRPPAPKPAPRKAVIYGLDDGPKEVILNKP